MPGIPPQRLNYRHRAIARWMLANPDRTLTECADELGYTLAWVSTVTNSDGFRHLIATLQNSADDAVIGSIPDKIRGVADAALEHLIDAMDDADMGNRADREFVRETADMALHRLGYAPRRDAGPPAAPTVINNIVAVDRALIEETRAALLVRAEVLPPPAPEKAA